MKAEILITCLTIFDLSLARIPDELRRSFEKAKSFKELASTLRIKYAPTHGAHRHHQHRHQNRDQDLHIVNSASIGLRTGKLRIHSAAQAQPGQDEIHDAIQSDLALLESISQGSDTCKLQSVCVPVNIQNDDLDIEIYPKCIEIPQCVGSCCLLSKSCKPHHVEQKIFQVVKLQYLKDSTDESINFKLNEIFNVTMTAHTSCSCHNCGTKLCPLGFELDDYCACKCPKKSERDCRGEWDPQTCTCKCGTSDCKGHTFDEKTCQCVRHKFSDLVRGREPEHELPKDKEDDDEMVDASILPTLKPIVSKGRGRH